MEFDIALRVGDDHRHGGVVAHHLQVEAQVAGIAAHQAQLRTCVQLHFLALLVTQPVEELLGDRHELGAVAHGLGQSSTFAALLAHLATMRSLYQSEAPTIDAGPPRPARASSAVCGNRGPRREVRDSAVSPAPGWSPGRSLPSSNRRNRPFFFFLGRSGVARSGAVGIAPSPPGCARAFFRVPGQIVLAVLAGVNRPSSFFRMLSQFLSFSWSNCALRRAAAMAPSLANWGRRGAVHVQEDAHAGPIVHHRAEVVIGLSLAEEVGQPEVQVVVDAVVEAVLPLRLMSITLLCTVMAG